jgi:pyridoxamine 5'-phosphate oxidase
MNLADFRKEYSDRGLRRVELDTDPIAQFSSWFAQAIEFGVHEPNAMTVATVDENGMPYQRTLLLKNVDSRGFTFFTNYKSLKAAQLEKNPRVCLLFPWLTLERQIIIQGTVEKVSQEESQQYFTSRPRESQIGAWVSNQSEVIASRDVLTRQLAEIRERFQDGDIPLPPHWGGYLVRPERIEFWQGGAARLHDRFIYQLENGQWKIERLSP